MRNIRIAIALLVLLSACDFMIRKDEFSFMRSGKKNKDYFGQTEPASTPEIFAKDIISVKGRLEHGISFAPDQLELAFGILNKDDFSGAIYHSKKVNNEWSAPATFEPLENESAFLPYFSPDGKSLLYTQSRPDTSNGFTDIWRIRKIEDSWIQPQKLSSPINSLSRESTACMTYGNKIYFSSNRNGNGLADLYCSSLGNGEYTDVERLNSISSLRDEESIFVSPGDRYIIFSRYATNENGPDLFISYRDIFGNWIEPELLDSAINSSDWERRPYVSIDNKYLFFTKLHFSQTGLAESDIYWVNTEKVFKPFVFNPLPNMTILVGQERKLSIPTDYFMDINDESLQISLNHEKFEWAEFDDETKTLTMTPMEAGEFELTMKALDMFANETEDVLKIKVEK